MDRWTWMVLKACFPAIVVLAFSLLAGGLLLSAAKTPLLAEIYAAASWVAAAGALLSLTMFGWVGVRLYRWEQGHGPDCTGCAGLLGHERSGRYGPYRRCLACGKNVAQRDYH